MTDHSERQAVDASSAHHVSSEMVHALLNATDQGIYGVDMDGKCTFANASCVLMLGCQSDEDLLGQNMHELIHHTQPTGEPYPVEDCHIYQAFREERGIHISDEIVWRLDGSSFPAEYWSHPIMLGGELAGCVVAFVDITERRKAEDSLRESEETVRGLLNATGQGIYGVDLDGNCTFANPSCVGMLGCQSDESLLGKNMHQLIHHTRPGGEPYPVEECHIYQAFREERGIHISDEIVWRLDGTSFPAEYWSHPIMLGGKLAGCVVAFVDISERVRVEEELRQSEKLSALGKMSAGLAHELNNPAAAAQRAAAQMAEHLADFESLAIRVSRHGLSGQQWDQLRQRQAEPASSAMSALDLADQEDAISQWLADHGVDDGWKVAAGLVAAGMGEAELDALASNLPDEALADAVAWLSCSHSVKELIGTVEMSTHSISELVAAVKQYSYMDRAPENEIDVHDGIESTLRILNHKLKQGTRIVREYDRGLPHIWVPAGELNQVWTNLIDNAIDAAGAGGAVTLSTYRQGDALVVQVADDGKGIPVDVQSRIFDPFFTTKDVGEGTGMGLDVARRIVRERCRGEIDFQSKPGDTRFWVRLPLTSP
ncbi:MAG TPA: ATP-binding protein [Dehalococcoidia bacterium]